MKYDFNSYLDVKNIVESEIRAKCPFHDDFNPSFSANIDTGLWKCHAGCGQGNYNQFLLSFRKLFPTLKVKNKSNQSKKSSYVSDFKTIDIYHYMTVDGIYGQKVMRQQDSNGNKRFFQESLDSHGQWQKRRSQIDLYPYLYPSWNAPNKNSIVFVEGEKCASFLDALGLAATTVAGGSSCWQERYGQYFQGKHVTILPDNDAPGKKFAAEVFKTLSKEPNVTVATFDMPALGHSEDVVDWILKYGGSIADLKMHIDRLKK